MVADREAAKVRALFLPKRSETHEFVCDAPDHCGRTHIHNCDRSDCGRPASDPAHEATR